MAAPTVYIVTISIHRLCVSPLLHTLSSIVYGSLYILFTFGVSKPINIWFVIQMIHFHSDGGFLLFSTNKTEISATGSHTLQMIFETDLYEFAGMHS